VTPEERDLAAALVRLIVERLRTQAGLLELVLESLAAEPGEAEGFDAAERRARIEGRLVAATTRVQ